MAKLGRYSADRKKIKALTASHTATVAECGTIFTAVGDAEIVLTLPSIADAGKGWWCKLIKAGAQGGGQFIGVSTHADDAAILGVSLDTTNHSLVSDDVKIIDGADGGSQLEYICDGTNWLVVGLSVANGDIVDY